MVSAYSIQEMTGQMSEAISLERKLVPLETETVDVLNPDFSQTEG